MIRLLTSFLFLFLFTGCFEIIHYLQKNPDQTISVVWNFSISSSLAKGGSNPFGGKEAAEGAKSDSLMDRMKNSEKEITGKFAKFTEDMKFQSYEGEYESGIKMSFKIKDLKGFNKASELDEGFPIAPKYDTVKNQLVFNFLPDKKQREANKAKAEAEKKDSAAKDSSAKDAPAKDENAPPMGEEGMEQIVGQIMSSASYNLILGGGFTPKKVMVVGKNKKDRTQTELDIMKLGDQTSLIRIPFFSLLLKEKEGYDVIITLQ